MGNQQNFCVDHDHIQNIKKGTMFEHVSNQIKETYFQSKYQKKQKTTVHMNHKEKSLKILLVVALQHCKYNTLFWVYLMLTNRREKLI